ncbi:MAG: hypothetical protein KTR25_19280 [Myxococcales bacterium]|nr:hypothetical protein [Myxococcales bacterium]
MLTYLFKWRLIAATIPYAAVALLLKLALTYLFNFEGMMEIQEVRLVFTSGIFLIGFMLAGTLADYKESEKIPGHLATLLEGLEEMSANLAQQTGIDPKHSRQEILELGRSIMDWFCQRINQDTIHDRLTNYNCMIQTLLSAGAAPPIVGRVHQYMFDIRATITRTHVISRTGFIPTGYALLELLIVAITVLLLLTRFHSLTSAISVVFFVELLYIYMYYLIWDIDDPFEYSEVPNPSNPLTSADVPLFPMSDYLRRLEKRLI